MKDTEGAVVTFEFSVFQIHKTEMYINRFLKITYIEYISNLIVTFYLTIFTPALCPIKSDTTDISSIVSIRSNTTDVSSVVFLVG